MKVEQVLQVTSIKIVQALCWFDMLEGNGKQSRLFVLSWLLKEKIKIKKHIVRRFFLQKISLICGRILLGVFFVWREWDWLPLDIGKEKSQAFEEVISRIKDRVEGWQA